MQRILIPTDFSHTARGALSYAVKLFGPDADYVLLHAFEDHRHAASSLILLKNILNEASLDSLAEEERYLRHELNFPDVKLSTVSEYGDPVTVISRYAKTRTVDVVVMGGSAAANVGKSSISSGVMQRVSCPVLTVPGKFNGREPRNILMAPSLENTAPLWFYDITKMIGSRVINQDSMDPVIGSEVDMIVTLNGKDPWTGPPAGREIPVLNLHS